MRKAHCLIYTCVAFTMLGAVIALADAISLELERSVNGLDGWVPVAVTPGMIASDGRLMMEPPQPAERVFLRLRIHMGAGVPMGFSFIPAGDFLMGTAEDEEVFSDEVPQHSVTLTRPFYMERTEVTWGEWNRVRNWALLHGYADLAAGQAKGPAGANADYPVIGVSWYDVVKWLNARSEMEGRTPVYTMDGDVFRGGQSPGVECDFEETGYRLPTEAEWEYACRAGTTTAFFTGPLVFGASYSAEPHLDRAGWYAFQDVYWQPVGLKEANSFGLYDTHGNVWEWCWDWHASYGADSVSDPTGPANGVLRIIRGGGKTSVAVECRSAHRDRFDPAAAGASSKPIGFRSVRTARVVPYESRILRLAGNLDFGEVEVGRTVIHSLQLTNEGHSPLTIHGFTAPAGVQLAFEGVVPPGASRSIDVFFTPTQVGPMSGEILFHSDATGGESAIGISGYGAQPAIVYVDGGYLPAISTLGELDVDAFEIGRFEVTWGEWLDVRAWGEANGYKWPAVAGEGCAADHPVHTVNWFDVVKWCNAKSEMEGLPPAYWLGEVVYREGESFPEWRMDSGGWRLPTEMEWEYAARGGLASDGFLYSGDNKVGDVGWYYGNSMGSLCPMATGRGTWSVGQKIPNELGLFDMSGNVFERCWETVGELSRRRGGSWHESEFWLRLATRNTVPISDRNNGTGFRLARSIAPGFVSLPTGTFVMGSPEDEPGRWDNETLREVHIERPFRIQQTEVTVGQWAALREWALLNGYDDLDEGWSDAGAGAAHPVFVPWYGAVKWLNAWSEREGRRPAYTVRGQVYRQGYETDVVCDFDADGYRLPTEEEWEYACRAGTTTAFYTGPITYPESGDPLDPNLDLAGWYAGNSQIEYSFPTRPVAGKEPNAFGLYDMHGNAWEWCWDAAGWPEDPASNRVIRGGSTHSSAAECRSAHRNSLHTFLGLWSIGFRPVQTITVGEAPQRILALGGDTRFGPVAPGETAAGVLLLTNEGTRVLTVQGIDAPDDFAASWSGRIAPGATQPVEILFTPPTEGFFEGTVQVRSDATGGSFQIPVTGRGLVLDLVFVEGGTLPAFPEYNPFNPDPYQGGFGQPPTPIPVIGPVNVSSFLIGRYEVTWGEWKTVRDWGEQNGYGWTSELWRNPDGCRDDHPVQCVNWFDALKWCNARSEMEGLSPVYLWHGEPYFDGDPYYIDELNRLIFIGPLHRDPEANGYRLPTEAEWEFAARGGTQSEGFYFSGGNDPLAVGWFGQNSGNSLCPISGVLVGTQPVGTKEPNELGLHDFSGNVWEWCWDSVLYGNNIRAIRGGSFRDDWQVIVVGLTLSESPAVRSFFVGFRVARNADP